MEKIEERVERNFVLETWLHIEAEVKEDVYMNIVLYNFSIHF